MKEVEQCKVETGSMKWVEKNIIRVNFKPHYLVTDGKGSVKGEFNSLREARKYKQKMEVSE